MRPVTTLRTWATALTIIVSSTEVNAGYLLGPQDRLTIRVYDLRRNTGEAYAWTALNGEFTVAADGTISLPIVGSIKAKGGTPNDLAEAIGLALKQTADLAEKPAASVQILSYRPYYITGSVQQPGKYEYQPDLTVLQAVSTAQGLVRISDPRSVRRDGVTSRGDLRMLLAERISLIAKQARLDAEVSGSDAISFINDPKINLNKIELEQAARGEQLLFETRKNALRAEVSSLEQSISSIRNELIALNSKSKALDRQLELSRGELDLVNDLVAKGLAITPRKLAAEQSRAAFESNRLDVQVSILRAQQNLTRAERDIIDLRARFRRDALTDSAETRLKLNQNYEKIRTSESLIADVESQATGFSDESDETFSPIYEIIRHSDEKANTQSVNEDSRVEPGDVIRVTLTRRRDSKTGKVARD